MELNNETEHKEIHQAGAFTESINPRKEPLTVEKVKTFEDFENVSDEEAVEILYTIDTLCRIVQEYLMHQNTIENNNPQNLAA